MLKTMQYQPLKRYCQNNNYYSMAKVAQVLLIIMIENYLYYKICSVLKARPKIYIVIKNKMLNF